MLRLSVAAVFIVVVFSTQVCNAAAAVPEADHVRIECAVLRLNVNDYTVRHQLKLTATVARPTKEELAGVEQSQLKVTNPAGEELILGAAEYELKDRTFKAANGILNFKLTEDSATPQENNVPPGYFKQEGPYTVVLTINGVDYAGQVSFGLPLAMAVEQKDQPVANFVLFNEAPVRITTEPREFGPVYYKHQDITNFVFQMANMDNSLETRDYHPQIETPRYVFQVRIGDNDGGPTHLLDPSRYIDGWQEHMIRSEWTSTPLNFSAEDFRVGDAVIFDFSRIDTMEPDSVFTSEDPNMSGQVIVQERVVYALSVEAEPTPEELGQLGSE